MRMRKIAGMARDLQAAAQSRAWLKAAEVKSLLVERRGQGTTEYAILVGVLVVIAIVAVIAFKDKLQDLWGSISEGINGL
jgi:Flp pilus assembly pilin Flp